jgi:uncharacterized protein YkwD
MFQPTSRTCTRAVVASFAALTFSGPGIAAAQSTHKTAVAARSARVVVRARRSAHDRTQIEVVRSTSAPHQATVKSTAKTRKAAPAPRAVAAASTAPCQNTDLMPAAANLRVVEAATLCLVNQVRGEHGLAALSENADLQSAAQEHSAEIVRDDDFAHDGPAGDTLLSRVRSSGYLDGSNGYEIAENIAAGTLGLATPAAIVSSWVNSPGHLANILDPSYRDTGIAIDPEAPASLAEGQAGATYTEDFGGR